MLVEEKLHKIINSCQLALKHLEEGSDVAVVGDMHFVKENADEIILLLATQVKEDDDNEKNQAND